MNSQIVPRQPQVDQAPQDLELTDVWKFLLRRWLILAVFCLLGLLAGFISYMRAPQLYNAVVTVEMNRDTTSGLGLQDLSGAGSTFGIGQEFMTDMLTQQAVLTNASTALSVIDHLQLMETPPYSSIDTKSSTATHLGGSKGYRVDPANVRRDRAVALFDSKLRVTPVKNTRLMNVAYTDPDPVRAAQVANAIVEAYLTNHTRTRYEATSKAATWLNQQLDDLKHQAEDTHHRVAALETNGGLIGTMIPTENGSSNGNGNIEAAGSNPDVSKLMALNAALNQADLARIQQGTIYQLSQTSDPNALLDVSGAKLAVGEGTALAAGSPAMQLIQNLRNQEASLKLRLASARVTYAAKNPVMQELQNQIDSIHSQIAEQMGMVQINAKRNYLLAQENENAIRKEVEAQQQKVTTLGNRLADLAFLREEEGSERKLYQDLYTRLQEADIAAGVRSSGMAVVDPARPPSAIASPNLKHDAGFGLLGGAFLGLILALLVQLRDTKLNIPEDFEEHSPYPLLGVIPGFEMSDRSVYGAAAKPVKATNETSWIVRSPSSPIAEGYRLIRTSLMLARVDHPPRVMIFTSPVGGDGKSTTTYNMAAAFAAQSSRTLLLDADMRRSTIGKLAGIPKGPGLSDVLSGQGKVEDFLHVNADLPYLSVLMAGTIPPDPSELLGSQRFGDLVAELRGRFDYILIDSPPALLVTDPIVASAVADGIVCVVRAGKTERPTLRRFWEAMRKPNTPVIGYIVNDFNRKLQSYAYGYEGYGPSGYRYYAPTEEKP